MYWCFPMMQVLDDDCESRIFNKYCQTWSEIFVQSFECGGICLRMSATQFSATTSFNFNIRTNHRPHKWDGNTTKYWRLAHRQNYRKIVILNNYWMRLSIISWIIKTKVCVICRSRRLRQITQTRGFDKLFMISCENRIQ